MVWLATGVRNQTSYARVTRKRQRMPNSRAMYVQKLYEEHVHCFMNGGLMTSGVPMDDRTKLRVTLAAISKEAEILGDRFCGVVRTARI